MKTYRMTEEEYQAHQLRIGRAVPIAAPLAVAYTPAPTAQPKREYHDYKADFLEQIQRVGLPMPSHGQGCEQKELQFARPRLWRFDWAYEGARIAIEYQGGNYTGKGHNTIKNLRNDYEKFTEASLLGWMLILIDSDSVKSGQAVAWVERALNTRNFYHNE